VRDGKLDVVFFPARSLAHALLWTTRCMVDDPRAMPGVVVAQGADITVESETPAPWQADGEAGGWLSPGERLRLGVKPGALHVLSGAP
jgi:diacylglycerol kinase family enzyme